MLVLKNVNKYFNKHKKNEIHVINNISLSFQDNGLIALLGPSGCGKTTLLNAIGGLDNIKSGSIYVNGKKISSKLSGKVDKIRNLNIGYIFQDYKLIDNISVYDNVAIVLTMLGIKDKKEIKDKVEYILDKVGMLRYKRRPASMLSGGERQRVGIARALVKNPDIILADEPTGNLDSKNSLEIMKIIKAISKDRLVILVTHEVNLAKFYASRIIELSDGKIVNDYINKDIEDLDYTIDNNIYLKDFKNHENIKTENKDINFYSDNKDEIKLDIILKNGNIYIKGNTNDKVEVIDEYSNIELINDNYKKIQEKEIEKYDFDIKDHINGKLKYSSIFNPASLIYNGFKKVFNFSFLKKLLLVGFLISGMFIMYSVSSIAAALHIKDEEFVKVNKNYLTAQLNKINVDDYLSYENDPSVDYILPGNSVVQFSIRYDDYYQTMRGVTYLEGSLSDIDMLGEKDIIYGRLSNNTNELVVDKLAIENMFKKYELSKMAGINSYEELVGKKLNIDNIDDFIIVGIVDKGSPSIYSYKDMFINILSNSLKSNEEIDSISEDSNSKIIDYSLFTNKIELKKGRLPLNDYEVIVNISNKDSYPLNKKIDLKVNGNKLLVVGYYFSKDNYQYYLTNNNTIKYNLIKNSKDMVIKSKSDSETIDSFREKNLNINNSYDVSKKVYMNERNETVNTSILVSIVILVISLIEIFLMIRASFLSRVKTVGIYRAIGIKKSDIYKMFYGEIFAITTLSSLPGILFAGYALNILSGIKYLDSLFLINWKLIIISIIFVYCFNSFIGLFPVFNTIRKKPAVILSRYDLD